MTETSDRRAASREDHDMNDGAPDVSWAFYWLDGRREVLSGDTATGALNRAGYGAGALTALDFYAASDRAAAWAWDPGARKWIKADKA